MSSVTGGIGFIGAEEYLNTLSMPWAYDQTREINPLLIDFLSFGAEVNPYHKEALESLVQVVEMTGIMKLVQYEEKFLIILFEVCGAILAGLLALSKKGLNKLKNSPLFGRHFKFAKGVLDSLLSDAIEKGKIVVAWLQAVVSGRKNSYESGNLMQASQGNRQAVIERDRSALTLAQGVSDNLLKTLEFKIKTRTFTANDAPILKKVLGVPSLSSGDIEKFNKIEDSEYTFDVNGNIVGIPQLMMALLSSSGNIYKAPTPSTPS